MPLQPPPASLDGFPVRRSSTAVRTLYRIFLDRDPATGGRASPWHFSAVPPGSGRFDLPAPRGTCYWSDRRYGAWLEVFRGALVVDLADARRRRLATGRAPALGSCSHDPTSTALNVAVFGRAGRPSVQPGWRVERSRVEVEDALLAELAGFGVHVAAVPYDVPTVPLP